MPIQTTNPIVVPETTYDNVGFHMVQIAWQDFNKSITASYNYNFYSQDEYGYITEAPLSNRKAGFIPDLNALALSRAEAGKPTLAQAMSYVLAALQEIEHEKGNI